MIVTHALVVWIYFMYNKICLKHIWVERGTFTWVIKSVSTFKLKRITSLHENSLYDMLWQRWNSDGWNKNLIWAPRHFYFRAIFQFIYL